MAQPDHAAFQSLAANQSQRLSGAGPFAVCALIVDDGLPSGQAIDRWENQGAELVDQAMLEKRSVDPAALEKEFLDAENTGELRHCAGEIVAPRTGENIGGAILAEFRQISVRDVLPQHRHDVIAPDIVLAIVDAAGGIDGDGQVPAVPTAEVRLARQRRADSNGSFAPLGQ